MAATGRNSTKVQLMFYLLLLILATLIADQGGVSVIAARRRTSSPPADLHAESQQATTNGMQQESEGVRPRSEEEEEATAAGIGISWPTTSVAEVSGRRRRRLVGSTAPTCTYNECRGCRHRCSAHGVPVDAGDPINSAYHYRCFCHI